MRKIISLLCVCLLLSLLPLPAQAEEPDWATAYEQVVSEQVRAFYDEHGDQGYIVGSELSYLLYDIDKDGTPELLIKFGTCEADYQGLLYSFRDGQAVQIGEELGLGHSSIYSDPGENGIILMWGHMGYASAERISLADGFASELLYEDNLNERLETDPDAEYIYPYDVIPGSVYLTLCRWDITLPLTHYEEICRCLDGDMPRSAEAAYPGGDAGFFESLMANDGEVVAVTADGFTRSPGRIGFQALLKQNVAADWMQGDLSVLSATPADLNGDGQLECVVAVGCEGGSEMRVILSEQDGSVYAYLMNYAEGYEPDADGNLCVSRYYPARYRLIFDREQAFLLSLPTV